MLFSCVESHTPLFSAEFTLKVVLIVIEPGLCISAYPPAQTLTQLESLYQLVDAVTRVK